jgi:hypothetical protein
MKTLRRVSQFIGGYVFIVLLALSAPFLWWMAKNDRDKREKFLREQYNKNNK